MCTSVTLTRYVLYKTKSGEDVCLRGTQDEMLCTTPGQDVLDVLHKRRCYVQAKTGSNVMYNTGIQCFFQDKTRKICSTQEEYRTRCSVQHHNKIFCSKPGQNILLNRDTELKCSEQHQDNLCSTRQTQDKTFFTKPGQVVLLMTRQDKTNSFVENQDKDKTKT